MTTTDHGTDEITQEAVRPATTTILRDLLMVPALTSVATAAFTLGGVWVTFGDIQAKAAENGDAIKAVVANLQAHERIEGHAVTLDRWDAFDKRLTRIENEDRRQGYNIVAICTVTGAACDLAVTP